MKKQNILLLLLTALLFTACNDDDADNNTNPPANQSASFSGTVTDMVNGPSSAFSAVFRFDKR